MLYHCPFLFEPFILRSFLFRLALFLKHLPQWNSDSDWSRLATACIYQVVRRLREIYFALGAEYFLQEQCAPPTIFRGFAHRSCPLHTVQIDHRYSHWSAASARTTPYLLASYALSHALLHARPPWRKKEPISSPACSKAHALMLQLSLGEFFFFFLTCTATSVGVNVLLLVIIPMRIHGLQLITKITPLLRSWIQALHSLPKISSLPAPLTMRASLFQMGLAITAGHQR